MNSSNPGGNSDDKFTDLLKKIVYIPMLKTFITPYCKRVKAISKMLSRQSSQYCLYVTHVWSEYIII